MRPVKQIEADLHYVIKAIEQTPSDDKIWEWLLRRYNELNIELYQSEHPVHQQKEAIKWIYINK